LTNYGDIGVMWFDGEWEHTWNHDRGKDLYEHVRSLQPRTIINNRVDVGRQGMEGMSKSGKYLGDFGTPEQQIPATGLPGVDWETCMTMNRHWGYNRHDDDWKSTEDLIRKLADIASKGGNFLLNVGPTAEGRFPEASIERLAGIGRWMDVNGESIHGTLAGPFPRLDWGRCTIKEGEGGAWRLYLHVFDWPKGGVLEVPAMDNAIRSVRLLADAGHGALDYEVDDGRLLVSVPASPPDPIDTVIVAEVAGRPVVISPPVIEADSPAFIFDTEVTLSTDVRNAAIHYTLDGAPPEASSPRYTEPLTLTSSTTVRARLFRDGKELGGERRAAFERVAPRPADSASALKPGLAYAYYEGRWEKLPPFDELEPVAHGAAPSIDLAPARRAEHFGLRYTGFVRVPADGVYTFYCDSDDGSRVFVGDRLVVDNDGLHGPQEVSGSIALAAGAHPVTIEYFQASGGRGLNLGVSAPGMAYRDLPEDWLFHR
jgi:alpha-L-fucosidase